MKIFWAVLKERSVEEHVLDALFDVCSYSAGPDVYRISLPYMRTDNARNLCVDGFMGAPEPRPDDVLVMLDCDHIHPPNVVLRLAAHPYGVVGALAFRRSESSDPLFFMEVNGKLTAPAHWEKGRVYECDFVGTGAIAIKRWVFQKLLDEGEQPPYFRIDYKLGQAISLGEDHTFAMLCKKYGIRHYCDTGLEIPHLRMELSTQESWDAWRAKNPQKVEYIHPRKNGVALPNIKTRVLA